ncbi:MAG TPA: hypothetical protein DD456_13810 [Stenotrophomonas sp.]|nr:hypothetical protein [Stenotrophomonas sp.]
MLGWMALRAVMQAVMVVILARMLGAGAYGQLVAVIAAASFLSPFVGLGLSNMVLRNAARDPAHGHVYFMRALGWWKWTLLPCVVVAVAVAMVLLPADLPVLAAGAAIAVEVAVTSMTELLSRYRQAQQNMLAYGAINAGLPFFRLVLLVLLFAFVRDVAVVMVFWAYAATGLSYMLLLAYVVPARDGRDMDAADATEPMKAASGMPFSLAAFTTRLQAEFNKPVLAQLGFGLVGSYNAAQRAMDIVSLPLLAMQEALWPRLYAQADPLRQLRRSGTALLAIALILGGGIWLMAPMLPRMLGESFADTVEVLRWLAWLPVLQMLRSLLNFHAIHHGKMLRIGWVYSLGAAVNIVLVAVLVTRWGMRGAAMCAYLAELVMIMALVATCLRNHHDARNRP